MIVRPTAKPTTTVSTDPPDMRSIVPGPALKPRSEGSSPPQRRNSYLRPPPYRLSAGPPPSPVPTHIVAKQPSYGVLIEDHPWFPACSSPPPRVTLNVHIEEVFGPLLPVIVGERGFLKPPETILDYMGRGWTIKHRKPGNEE